jgi:hypothetical protein
VLPPLPLGEGAHNTGERPRPGGSQTDGSGSKSRSRDTRPCVLLCRARRWRTSNNALSCMFAATALLEVAGIEPTEAQPCTSRLGATYAPVNWDDTVPVRCRK